MAYEAIIDDISREDWERYAGNFADYSIYQTWPYQKVRAEMDGQEISRVIIKDEDERVATMGQVRIKHVKPLGLRIGYVQWGPLVRGLDGCLRCTREALNTLRRTYVGTRINVLRIVPNVCDNETGDELAKLLETSGFYRVLTAEPFHTMFLSLNSSEGVLRKRLHQSWRRQLYKAEKNELEIVESQSDESFAVLGELYLETIRRKGFKGLDPQVFIRTQRMLSPSERFNLILAYCDGAPVSAHLTSNLGDSGVFLLGGSSKEGLALRASYLTWWRAVTLSNQMGIKRYDVGGIDFKKNPTVSRFKAGMGGEEAYHIGTFDACSSITVKKVWRAAEKVYRLIKK